LAGIPRSKYANFGMEPNGNLLCVWKKDMVIIKNFYNSTKEYIVERFFNKGYKRSITLKKNIVASFLIRGINIPLSFTLVPLTLHYLNPTKYGIWLTLSSIIAWSSFFDIGLGNGLMNRLAESLAKGDNKMARAYVSTTYAILSIIMAGACLAFFVVNFFLDWSKILNAPAEMKKELFYLALWVFCSFSLKMVFNTINVVLIADQRVAYVEYLNFIINLISLVIVIIVRQTIPNSLFWLGVLISVPTFIVPLCASLYYFNSRYKEIAPSIKLINFKYGRNLMSIGIQFFILQISGIITFSTANIIISHLLGPSSVTIYNIAFKYFSIVTIIFTIIISPLWPAFTNAYTLKDFVWIRKIIRKMIYLWGFIVFIVLIMFVISNLVYRLWVGGEIKIPILISLLMGVFVIQSSWKNIFVSFLNGISKIRLQLYCALFGAFICIPLSIVFTKHLGLGAGGTILGAIVSLIPTAIFMPLQVKLIMKNKASGIFIS
jgi:O-antigen/teichoic acid export membrane protein